MRAQPVVAGVVPVLTAGGLGNAFVSKNSLAWFQALRRPRTQLPLPACYAVGAAYYLSMGVVTCRAAASDDGAAYRLALAVLAGNELWNVALFGRRSPATASSVSWPSSCRLAYSTSPSEPIGPQPSPSALKSPTAYGLPWSRQLRGLNPSKNP